MDWGGIKTQNIKVVLFLEDFLTFLASYTISWLKILRTRREVFTWDKFQFVMIISPFTEFPTKLLDSRILRAENAFQNIEISRTVKLGSVLHQHNKYM